MERKEYYKQNKDKILKQQAEWRKNNPDKLREKWKKQSKSKLGKYKSYKKGAEKRNYNFDISFNEFKKYWQQDCYYCGGEIETIGLDRKNNLLGYEKHNLIPCCYQCNLMKLKLNDKEFIKRCKQIAKRF